MAGFYYDRKTGSIVYVVGEITDGVWLETITGTVELSLAQFQEKILEDVYVGDMIGPGNPEQRSVNRYERIQSWSAGLRGTHRVAFVLEKG